MTDVNINAGEVTSIRLKETTVPATPAAGYVRLFAKTTGIWFVDDAGAEFGPFIPQTLAAAKGDLIAATAADAFTILTVGTDDYVLTADADAATGLKWAAAAVGGGGAPDDVDYWVETADGGLSNEVVVGTTGITTNAFGSRQAAAKAGRLFFPNNGFYAYRDTGAAWGAWGPIFPLTPPPAVSTLTWVNQGTGTATETNGAIYLYNAADGGDNWRMLMTTLTAPFTLTVAFINHMMNVNYQLAGIVMRQSSDGKLVTFAMAGENDGALGVKKWNSETNWNANYQIGGSLALFGPLWLQVTDDNTNRIFKWSTNGQNYHTFYTVGRTDFMTADQIGFGVNPRNGTYEVGATIIHWVES